MSETMAAEKPIIIEGAVVMPYRYYVGTMASRFFAELRDNKRILGIRCLVCDHVYVPPMSTCPGCFAKLEEWVEVRDEGRVTSFTMVHYATRVQPVAAPLVYGIIQLEGADTGLVHLINDVNFSDIKIGMRVKAIFKKQREGNILDIRYFRPL